MRLLVSALERSANLHLSYLLPHLDAELIGIFDASLGDPLVDLQSLSVMGFVDALGKLPFFLRLKSRMVDLAAEADKVLLIDGSGFNLPLAKSIKARYPDKEIFYYILPQAWAWRRGRIEKIERYVDHALSILPFESRFYSDSYDIRYVGHPLLDEITSFKSSPTPDGPVAFLPGSRRREIASLMPIFRQVRQKIDKEALLVVPPHFTDLSLYGDISGFEVVHDTHEALMQSSFAFVCSGTATLESALIGTPLALVYQANPIDYHIAKMFAHIDKVGLANILMQEAGYEAMHPEFLQKEASAHNLLRAYHASDPQTFLERSRLLREYLGHGSAKKVAEAIDG